MADARREQGKESRKMMDDQDRVPDNTSGSDMDIKLEPSELLENCSMCGKGFQSKNSMVALKLSIFKPTMFLSASDWLL